MSDPELDGWPDPAPSPPPPPPGPPSAQGPLGPVTARSRGLYRLVVLTLGTVLLLGVVGWIGLAAAGRTMPEGLAILIGTVAGALVGLISS